VKAGVLVLLAWLGAGSAAAQVVLDGSFGAEGELLPDAARDVEIPEAVGRRAGTNLFHSFSELSVPAETSATFSAESAGIERVLARVTGGNASRIEGLLRSRIPGADLYLLNPQGVIFGRDAALDLPGSLYLGGAESLLLADGVRFWSDPASPVVLSSAPPSAWGFSDEPAGPIEIAGSALVLAEGTTLSLAGSEVRIRGRGQQPGEPFGFRVLQAPRGYVDLVAVTAGGDARLGTDGIDASGIERLGPVSITDRAQLDGTSRGASQLRVRADSLLLDGAFLFFDNLGGAAEAHPGRALDLEARTRIEIDGGSELTSESFGAGRSGDVRLVAPELSLDGDSTVQSVASGVGASGKLEVSSRELRVAGASSLGSRARASGRAGDVSVSADAIRVSGGDSVLGSVTEGAGGSVTGDGGDVTVHAGTIELRDGGQILVRTRDSAGNAGRLRVVAERIDISGISRDVQQPSGLLSTEEVGANPRAVPGRGGDMEVEVGQLHISEGGEVGVRSFVEGDLPRAGAAPQLRIEAASVHLSGFSQLSSGGVTVSAIKTVSRDRDAGDLTVTTHELELRDGGAISASTIGAGASGTVTIRAERLRIVGSDGQGRESGIYSQALDGGSGDAGSIWLAARELELRDGGTVSVLTDSSGSGAAGRVSINDPAREGAAAAWSQEARIVVTGTAVESGRGSAIRSSVIGASPAAGGEIAIHARELVLGPGGAIEASNQSLGDAGNVTLDLVDALRIEDGTITTSSQSGEGGGITIRAGELVELVGGQITTNVSGTGSGGNIAIDPDLVVLSRGSRIDTTAAVGDGGDIRIVAGHFLMSADSTLDTRSLSGGVDGEVVIESPVAVLADEVAALPDRVLDASDQLRRGCAARRTRAGSLTVAPRVVRVGPQGVLGSEGERGECPAR
jgi:filamentous hemagglutinin family protein